MEAKLIKMMEGYIVSLTGDIDDIYAITNKELAEEHGFYSLSLKNCKEVELGYDLDKLFQREIDELMFTGNLEDDSDYRSGMYRWAKILLEILGDKKFSEEDMMQLVKSSFYAGLSKGQGKNQDFNIDDYVKKHLQQTEWDVEIIKEYVGECKGNNNDGCFQDSPGHDCGCYEYKPKLDENGCLILKRK